MPEKFDTKRIYELPILKHNIAAIKLIYSNALGEELSNDFLAKATEHSKLLAKLIILDNIPVGCIYSHIEISDSSHPKSGSCLVIDYVCVLKSYQHRGIGTHSINKLIERTKSELKYDSLVALVDKSCSCSEFFTKYGFVDTGLCEFSFDGKSRSGNKMVMTL